MPKPKDAPQFTGFQTPYFTQIPNEVFDDLLADLSGAEWKVLSYIMRKTYGWHKDADDIGLKQLTDGIPGVDRGTGLAKSTVALALKSLEEWGLIDRQQNSSVARGDLPTTYRVRLSYTERGQNRTPLASENGHARVLASDTQKIPDLNTNTKDDPYGRRLRELRYQHPHGGDNFDVRLATAMLADPDPAKVLARMEGVVAEAKKKTPR